VEPYKILESQLNEISTKKYFVNDFVSLVAAAATIYCTVVSNNDVYVDMICMVDDWWIKLFIEAKMYA
jgi:hypothetical protein